MSLNGVSGVSNTSTTTKYADTAAAAEKKSTENKDYGKDAAAVYKPSAESKTAKQFRFSCKIKSRPAESSDPDAESCQRYVPETG